MGNNILLYLGLNLSLSSWPYPNHENVSFFVSEVHQLPVGCVLPLIWDSLDVLPVVAKQYQILFWSETTVWNLQCSPVHHCPHHINSSQTAKIPVGKQTRCSCRVRLPEISVAAQPLPHWFTIYTITSSSSLDSPWVAVVVLCLALFTCWFQTL